MKIKITYFVHGTTTDNEQGIATGQNPGELSELGKEQSIKLKNQIQDKFDFLFSSDLKRAVDSIRFTLGNDFIQNVTLRECNYGDLNGAKVEKVDYATHIHEPFPNGESLEDVEKRVRVFLKRLKDKYDGKHIAIVAHKAPQLALDVILKGKTWEQAINEDWRKTGNWQPGWVYELK